jgi:hypothetical protein
VAAPVEVVAVAETVAQVEAVAAVIEVAAPVVETPQAVVSAPVSELIQIETVASKVAAIIEQPAARPAPVNRRRARPLEVYVENEPLVQIETQNPKV